MARARLIAFIVVVAVFVVVPSSALGREDPRLQEMAAQAYVDAYGGSKDEALRRLELQDAITPLVPKIEETVGDAYGGSWFDPKDGGRFKVAVTAGHDAAAGRLEELLRAHGKRGLADIVRVSWSFRELQAGQAAVNEVALGVRESGIASTGFDVTDGTITVRRASEPDAAERDATAAARNATDLPIREVVTPGYAPRTTACTLPYCDRPLRGGVAMNTVRGLYEYWCTAGFNVRSRSDNRPFLLTAGHCLEFNDLWDTKFVPGGAWHRIGETWNRIFPGGVDAGIIRVDGPSGEFNQSPYPGPYVAVDYSGGTSYNESYYIGNEASYPPQNTVLCFTGGGGRTANGASPQQFWHGTQYASWSWCGVVLQPSTSADFGSGQIVNNLIETNMCFHGGMSGGPTYKTNLSYGTITGASCTWSGAWGYIYPTWLSEDLLNVNIVH